MCKGKSRPYLVTLSAAEMSLLRFFDKLRMTVDAPHCVPLSQRDIVELKEQSHFLKENSQCYDAFRQKDTNVSRVCPVRVWYNRKKTEVKF